MKTVFTLVGLILLSGCTPIVTGKDINKFQKLCEPHGGIDFIKVSNDRLDLAFCVDNGVLVDGDDK